MPEPGGTPPGAFLPGARLSRGPLGRTGRSRARRHPLVRFVVIRVLAGLGTLLVVTILIFVAVQVLPGNIASVILGRQATPTRIAAIDASLHLTSSLPARYVTFIENMATGHFGDSSAALAQGQTVPVWTAIRTPLRNSLVLATITMIVFLPLCIFLGTVSALRAGRKTDHAVSTIALAFGAMPEFLVGAVLIAVFFVEAHWLPPVAPVSAGQTPFTHPNALVLPVLTLLIVSVAFGIRLLRASTLGVLRENYVAMARLNGYSERRVIRRYVLRNSIAPFVQIVAQEAQYLIGGIIVVESVFGYPGIGSALVQAIMVRDAQEVTVIATILAAMYIFLNIVADLAVVLLVPRLRTEV